MEKVRTYYRKILLLNTIFLFVSLSLLSCSRPIEYSMPIIKLNNHDNLSPDRYTWVNSSLTVINGLEEKEFYNHQVQMRGRGNSTWNRAPIPKLPYRFRFFQGNENAVLGLAEARDFVLLANAFDNSHLRNYFAYTLAREISSPESFQPSSIHVKLYLNGDFQGIYLLTEQMQVHENRVSIDLERGDWYLEMDGRSGREPNIEGIHFINNYFGNFEQAIDLSRTPGYLDRTEEQISDLRIILNSFNDSLLRKDNTFHQYINIDSFINFWIVQVLMQNWDIGFSSVHFKILDGIIHMGPLWDFDNAAFTMRNASRNINTLPNAITLMPAYLNNGWFRYLMRNDDFAYMFYQRWLEVLDNELATLLSKEEELINRLLPAVYLENERWGNYWSQNYFVHLRGMFRHWNHEMAKIIEDSTFEEYVGQLFEFFRHRSEFLTQELGRMYRRASN